MARADVEVAPAPGFDALYSRQHERLVTALVVAGGDRELAEDVAHEAFIRVLLAWSRVREPDGYLYRTAFRLLGRALGRARWDRSLRGMPRAPLRPDESVLRQREVDELLARLTPRQRACAVLVHFLGYGTDQAATLLGIRPETVRVHLHHVRRAAANAVAESIEMT